MDGQGETVVLGTDMSGLSPGIARPVEPSGMLEPTETPAVDGFDVDVSEAVVELAEVLEPHPAAATPPPPSNGVLEAVFGHGASIGLSPLTLSSVAPSGIPAESVDDELDGVLPSGEVVPMPEGGF